MVTVEPAMAPELEKRTRLLAGVLFVLGGLALLAPLLTGSNAESRVGLLLLLAAAAEVYHGFSTLERRIAHGGLAERRGHRLDGSSCP